MLRKMTCWLAIGMVVLSAVAVAGDADADGPDAWDQVRRVSLWSAVDSGLVEASGARPSSYRQVELTVRSKSSERVAVDYGGSHLRPTQRGACQRLGLGPPVVADANPDDPPPAVVLLEPGQKTTVLVNAVCLDVRRKAPRDQRFVGVAKQLPAVREGVLRWWVANPAAPQSSVNNAIWSNRESVIVHEWEDLTSRRETSRTAAAHGGVYYQVKNHELTSLDGEGVRRVLGSELQRVFPGDEAVYATMPGEDGAMDLWRLAPTGENPWAFIADIDPAWEIVDLIQRRRGEFVLVTTTGIRWFNPKTRAFKDVMSFAPSPHVSTLVAARTGSVYVTTHTAADPGKPQRGGKVEGAQSQTFELWRIDPKSHKVEKEKTFWNIGAIRAGAGGVFALSPNGQLKRKRGGKFKDMQSTRTYSSIVRVGRRVVWLMDTSGVLTGASVESGRRFYRSKAKITKETWFEMDRKTDDLTYTDRNAFWRVSAADGVARTVDEAEDRD
jgi:hypothetical protein